MIFAQRHAIAAASRKIFLPNSTKRYPASELSMPTFPDTPDDSPHNTVVVRGRKVLTTEGERPAAIHIRDGVIIAISNLDEIPSDSPVFDAGDLIVMPGLVDTHVHINEPGRTEWEGFSSATQAAAAGGITTLVDMPLNCIPVTTTAEAFHAKLEALGSGLWVDTGFWGGVTPESL